MKTQVARTQDLRPQDLGTKMSGPTTHDLGPESLGKIT